MTMRENLIELLLKHPQGLPVDLIAIALNCDESSISNLVRRIYGCYIASWTKTPGAPRAVWAIISVPANAPRESLDWKNPDFRKAYMKDYRTNRPTPTKKAKPAPAPAPSQPTGFKTVWRSVA
jgi:hypothetical protein